MVAPPGGRFRRARTSAVITVLVVAMVAAGCRGKPRDEILVEVAPTVPGTLTVATTLPAPGFWEGDDVTIVGGGYEWGLARSLADEFDLNLKIIDVPFADIVAGDLGGADMALSQIEITDERLEVLDFSLPYYASDFGVLTLAGETVRDLAAARELRWSVVDGARQRSFLDITIRPDEPVLVVSDDVAAADAIRSGSVDAALIDLSSALIQAHDDDSLGVAAKFVTGGQYSVALPKGSANLEKVDAALRGFQRDGTLNNLAETWLLPLFSTSPDDVPEIVFR
ncbi:MAG TPA: ABC transporter substrate-binding protein [Ilumatobacteraceae bacterium]|nr:ABC transporter substrate-binding protein [Ilumatobacteraceae bacterium]